MRREIYQETNDPEIIAEWGDNIGNIISDESSIYTSSSFMIEADFLYLYDGRILN